MWMHGWYGAIIVPSIVIFSAGWREVLSVTFRALYPPPPPSPVSVEYESRWAAGLVWKRCRNESYFFNLQQVIKPRLPGCPAGTAVAIPTELSVPLAARSKAVRLLRLWVQIPPGAWISVCCECCVLSGRGLCDELITRPEEFCWLWCVVCDLETSWMRRPWPTGGLPGQKQTNIPTELSIVPYTSIFLGWMF